MTTYYGPVTLNEGLYNLQIGPNGWKQANREKLEHGGTLQSISMYCITGGGYSAGTGGSMSCRVETDDGSGFPSGTLVSAGATATISTPTSSAVRTWTFGTPPVVTQGQLVHFVFTNVDGSPTANYISLDNIDVSGYGQLPQPTIPDSDRFVNYFDSGAWVHANEWYYPIFRTLYSDGFKGGQSYYEAGSPHYVGGLLRARQNITPASTVAVAAVQVSVAKYTSTSADLVINLRDLTNTVLLATTSIPASSIHLGDNTRYGCRFVRWALPSTVTLTAGVNYAIELTSTETTDRYMIVSTRYGGIPASFGALFDSDSRCLDMLIETSSNGGSSWANPDTGQSQLQAFFEIADAGLSTPARMRRS